MDFQVNIDPTRETLLIKTPDKYRLTTAELEEFLTDLGEARSKMFPSVPSEWPGKIDCESVTDASWSVEVDNDQGRPVIHFREPFFGWLHFCFSPTEARRLATELLAKCDAARALPASAGTAPL